VLASTNGGSAVSFSSASKDVWCDYPSGKAVALNSTGHLLVNTSTDSATFCAVTTSSSTVGSIIQAASGQSVDVARWTDPAGSQYVYINNTGQLRTRGQIACDGGLRTIPHTLPTGLTVTAQGSGGSTTYGYRVTARAFESGGGETTATTEVTVSSAATLTGSNFNRITWTGVVGASDYRIYRTRSDGSPTTLGLIGTVTANSTLQLDDTGLTPTGSGFVSDIVLTNQGSGYTTSPTVSITGGGGSSAAANARLGINGLFPTIASGGTGYTVGDTLTIVGGTSTTTATVSVTSVSGGVVTAVSVGNQGVYSVAPSNPVSTTGGTGTGCTLTLDWNIVIVNITNVGTGYTSAPTVAFSTGAATAVAYVDPTPQSDSSWWIGNGTAPGSSSPYISSRTITDPTTGTKQAMRIAETYNTPVSTNGGNIITSQATGVTLSPSLATAGSSNYTTMITLITSNNHGSTGTLTTMEGVRANTVQNAGSGTITLLRSFLSNISVSAISTTVIGFHSSFTVPNASAQIGVLAHFEAGGNTITSGASIGSEYGLFVQNLGGTGISNAIGTWISTQSGSTNNVNLLIASSSTAPSGNFSIYNNSTNTNYHAGRTLMGTTTDDSSRNLQVAGDTALNVGSNGQAVLHQTQTELLTIAAAATSTTTFTIPANAVVLGVSVRVTTVIPTATTFTVKVGSTTVSTAAVSTAAGSTDPGTAAGTFYNSASNSVTITPNSTPGANTGRVRVTAHYYTITPPTS
jgi:hypothetical protein